MRERRRRRTAVPFAGKVTVMCERVLFAAALAAASFLVPGAAGATDARQQSFAAAVDDAVARYNLPGIAVGVVEEGEVIAVETRGELVAGSGDAVDRDTIFKIASNSKAMTTALLARLVDAGKLAWDDPVVKHLPGFRMHDPWVTREIQVRDLLIHNSGLGAGAGDLMLWPEPNLFTREDVIAGLAHLVPETSFRSRYAYDNTLYIVAGEVAAAAGGAPYDALMRREVFEPLGLDRCRVGEWRVDEAGNVAQPHMRVDGRNVAIREDSDVVPDVPMAAAGGIRCSLDDMLAWARMWLSPETVGLVDGKPWLSQAQREAVWTTHTPMPLTRRMRAWDDSHFSAYGYGWRLTDVDGTWKVSHTGTLSGMYSALTLLPEKNAGFVILINGNADEARTVLTQVLVKHFTAPGAGLDVAHYAEWLAAERTRQADDAAPSPKAEGAAAAASRTAVSAGEGAAWTGRWRDPWFGEVSICPAGDGIRFEAAKSPKLAGRVMRTVGGRLLVDWDDADVDAEAWLDFAGDGAQPERLTMAKVDPEADFSYDYEDLAFVRTGDCPRR
jgi:CubicO group peptidase (beta-lactamase class C family)